MKIGICGSQSVGKTTLLNALRSEKCFNGYSICNEVTRTLKEYGIAINEEGNDLTQKLIMQQHIYNAVMFDNMLTDRTAIDGYVYTKSLYTKHKVHLPVLKDAHKVMCRILPMYDYIFYIKPEFAIDDDGVRSADKTWQDEITTLFDSTIQENQINVVNLSGSVRERVNTVLKTIGEL